ncbi:hypothetical protein BJ912DRAFT_953997, partial [Pholiota molesta]
MPPSSAAFHVALVSASSRSRFCLKRTFNVRFSLPSFFVFALVMIIRIRVKISISFLLLIVQIQSVSFFALSNRLIEDSAMF